MYQVCDQYGNCTIVAVLGCATYVYTNDEPGGGGGGNGDDSESCGECSPTQPCQNTGGVPEGCPVITVEVDPCETDGEHPDIEVPEVQSEMYKTWEDSYGTDSNPLPHSQRNEKMIMVLTTSSGYEIEEIPPGPDTSSCKFNFDGRIPSNIAALIHTHPYSDGDPVNDPRCPSGKIYDGDDVSDGDRNLAHQISNSSILPPTPIYVMDKDKIRVIAPSDSTNYSDTINRCGY